ncbi:MAG: site-specific DNA-methyltransferase [Ruminococcus sp. 37_24]|nr:MAG: site-specific DNA-methyltransferase [Ruminococcus sp. 37_24]
MLKLKMRTSNKADENYKKLAEMFPNAVTEAIDETTGKVVRAIDKDVLMQEISCKVVDGNEERYQFTWPDKKKSVLLANAPINKTLRPCREESVDFDGTENLYIEGDNLEVLKLLQETYLGKIKMIYIDPPYNTGNDFVYEDDFAENTDEYLANSGQFDDEGNRLVQNTESNGRFHTDWLNMIYPRLKLAKDLLSDDGVIFISIDDNEVGNLRKVCDEVFGEDNFRNQIVIRRGAKSVQAQFDTWDKLGQGLEYILFYTKRSDYRFPKQMKPLDDEKCGGWNNHWRGTDRPTMRYDIFGITPERGQWRWGKDRSYMAIDNYQRMLNETGQSAESVSQLIIDTWYLKQNDEIDLLRLSETGKPEHYIPPTNETLLNSSWVDLLVGSSSEIGQLFSTKVFDTAKLTSIITRMLNFVNDDSIILDFFSGSATTAHAVMQLNAEDGGKRKFIMVQIPEETSEKSEAYKAGYKNICEIGKERIRRAAKKIAEENPKAKFDGGFRVLKLDSSNMKDVYYNPEDFYSYFLDNLVDNIKEDRTPEDLLFQVMLDLGILLSSKIEESVIGGKKVFNVENNYLIACFDENVTEDVITEIAKHKPYYFVMRDSSMANDSVATNFEQIFASYSPDTIRKVL